jgi:4-hydroxybenzoyl-CoA thioesterase
VGRRHIHRYRIAFVDCDPAQIVHFSNYFRWFDTASREFFTACGVPSWRDTERESGIIVMRHIARRGDTVLAEGREVRVFAVRESVDPPKIRAVAVPAEIREQCS